MIPGITPAAMATLVGVLVMQLAIATPAAAGPPYDGIGPAAVRHPDGDEVQRSERVRARHRADRQPASGSSRSTSVNDSSTAPPSGAWSRSRPSAARAVASCFKARRWACGGIAWDVVMVEASGAMSGAVLSHGGGMLMFGTCSN